MTLTIHAPDTPAVDTALSETVIDLTMPDAFPVQTPRDDRAWEETTVGALVCGQPVYVNELRRAFERVESRHHWKGPISALVPEAEAPLIVEAVKYFHADNPSVVSAETAGYVWIVGKGYQAY